MAGQAAPLTQVGASRGKMPIMCSFEARTNLTPIILSLSLCCLVFSRASLPVHRLGRSRADSKVAAQRPHAGAARRMILSLRGGGGDLVSRRMHEMRKRASLSVLSEPFSALGLGEVRVRG